MRTSSNQTSVIKKVMLSINAILLPLYLQNEFLPTTHINVQLYVYIP